MLKSIGQQVLVAALMVSGAVGLLHERAKAQEARPAPSVPAAAPSAPLVAQMPASPGTGTDFAACLAALAPAGGWCELSGSKIEDVFPTGLSATIRGATGPAAVVRAWNGAAWDAKRRKWYFHGGGHADYGGNEVYEWDLASARFTRLIDPAPIPAKTAAQPCPAPVRGPRVQHTYDGIVFSHATDTIWVFDGGTGYCQSGNPVPVREIWEFNPDRTETRNGLAPLSWREHADIAIPAQVAGGYKKTAELPDGRIIVSRHAQAAAFFDPRTRRFSPIWSLNVGHTNAGTMATAADGRMFAVTEPSGIVIGVPGGANGRAAGHTQGTHNNSGAAFASDGRLYVWSGGPMVARFDPATKRWQVARRGPGPINRISGIHSKWIHLPAEGVFLGLSNWSEGVWVYRPPAESAWHTPSSRTAQSYIDQATAGGRVDIPPGVYGAGIKITKALTVGLKGVALGGLVERKAPVVVATPDPVVIEDYAWTDRITAPATAALRTEGPFDLTVRRFHAANTTNGILTGNDGGRLVVEDFLIENMSGTGQAHGIYFGLGDELVMRNGTIRAHGIAQSFGHLYKSRALRTILENVKGLGGDGRYSRELDFPCGGTVIVRNSEFRKGPNSVQQDHVALATEAAHCSGRTERPASLAYVGNTLTMERMVNRFGTNRSAAGTTFDLRDNAMTGLGGWGEFPPPSRGR